MKTFYSLLILAMSLLGSAQFDPVTEYPVLLELCEAGGSDSVSP